MKPTQINNPEYFHKVIDCQFACPSHTPVPEYIRLIDDEQYDDAYMINWVSNVFPGVLGRICDRPCEPACRRGRIDEEPVAICRLKRLAADNKKGILDRLPKVPSEKNGKKIALIGGGPASLTVARDLLPLGYQVDLYDNQEKAGGFIRTQVPSFRLPEKVLNEEVDLIINMGVTTHFNEYVTSLKAMLARDYDAIFVGTGAPRGRDLPDLPGRGEAGAAVHIGIDWLAAILYRHIKQAGRRVLVLGGGNTAMDCCRTARRLGGEDVRVVVRSPKEEMKASPWDIEDAEGEDIQIIDNHAPLEFVVENGKLIGMRFDRVKADLDEQGRRRLVSTGEEPVFIACDEVLLAVAHGHQAAISIDLFCQGRDLLDRPAPQVNLLSQKMGIQDWLYNSQVSDADRQAVLTVDKVRSLHDRLLEVELGFDRDRGQREAKRCLNCDVQTIFTAATCIECDACVDICPVSCINFTDNGDEDDLRGRLLIAAENRQQALYVSPELATGRVMVKDENVCLHCGLCAERCPTSSWEMVKFFYTSAQAGDK